jgi:hypothetical protein
MIALSLGERVPEGRGRVRGLFRPELASKRLLLKQFWNFTQAVGVKYIRQR